MDPGDAALLAPFRQEVAAEGLAKAPTAAEVSWMRTSNLFTRRSNAKRKEALRPVQQ